jgi:hypothetical protein
MALVKDDKDWTWVLDRPCPECGLNSRTLDRADIAPIVRSSAAAWQPVLSSAAVRDRPAPDVWSALEYGCHVRDVFVLFDERLLLMLTEDDARFTNWDQDETAVARRYGEQNPSAVARDLAAAGEAIADRFDTVTGEQWDRTGSRSDGATFTVVSFARYLVHDVVHHLYDVRAPLVYEPP